MCNTKMSGLLTPRKRQTILHWIVSPRITCYSMTSLLRSAIPRALLFSKPTIYLLFIYLLLYLFISLYIYLFLTILRWSCASGVFFRNIERLFSQCALVLTVLNK